MASAAVGAEKLPLDPQLELLIQDWPTLSPEIQQQQIMLLVG